MREQDFWMCQDLIFDFVRISWPLPLCRHCICLLKRYLAPAPGSAKLCLTMYNYTSNQVKTTTTSRQIFHITASEDVVATCHIRKYTLDTCPMSCSCPGHHHWSPMSCPDVTLHSVLGHKVVIFSPSELILARISARLSLDLVIFS